MPGRNQPSIETTRNAVHEALRNWGKPSDPDTIPFKALQIFRDGNVAHVLGECLDELRIRNSAQSEILERHFLRGQVIKQVALELHISEDHANRQQREAINALADMLIRKEERARRTRSQRLLAQLPPPTYERLFGTEQAEEKLRKLLARQGPPWVIALTGLGGLGKTALADTVVRTSADEHTYSNIIWLRVDPAMQNPTNFQDHFIADLALKFSLQNVPTLQHIEEIRKLLKKEPYLIVIDNVEKEIQELDWLYLLQDIAGPSKILLTGRVLPGALANIHVTKMRELEIKPATEFMVDHAKRLGFTTGVEELQDKAASIYSKTGGNPLALKLTIGLMHAWPLSAILRSLEQGPGSDVEAMYRHIFENSWQTISAIARQMLQAMSLVGEDGGPMGQLQAVSGLSELETREALKELVTRSLVELRSATTQPRYGIHRLTETFLRGKIVKTL